MQCSPARAQKDPLQEKTSIFVQWDETLNKMAMEFCER